MEQIRSDPLEADSTPCGLLAFADDGRLLAANVTLLQMLRLDRIELGSKRLDDLLAPSARVLQQMVFFPMLRLQGRVSELSMTLRATDGDDVHVLANGLREELPGGAVNRFAFMQLTERKSIEDRLLQIKRAIDQLPGAIYEFVLRPDGSSAFPFASDAIRDVLGLYAHELQDSAQPFFAIIHPDDLAPLQLAMRQSAETLGGGRLLFRILRPGDTERWCKLFAKPRRQPDGSVLWSGYMVDATRYKQFDDRLRDSDRLQAIAILAAGVAHDFNNLLGSMMGLAELCQAEASEGSRQARNLARILEAGHKASVLVRQMLDFSRQTPTSPQPIAIGRWLMRRQPLLGAGLPANVRLAVEVRADATAMIDTAQIEQALLNLVNNAAYAMRAQGGDIRIVVDLEAPARWTNQSAAKLVRVRVIDAGEGIPPESLSKIFEPFYTTKPIGEGTGLGLSSVHGVVSSHGGRVEVSSDGRTGTTFSVFLPQADASKQPHFSAAKTSDETTIDRR